MSQPSLPSCTSPHPLSYTDYSLISEKKSFMGCSSCGTGKPNGCKSNGGCSSGGCNRLNVYDWLANLPFSDPESSCRVIELSFNNGSRKDFYRNNTLQTFIKGDMVAVETSGGFDVGMVNLTGELVRIQLK
ncbi:MAG: hypothetical protein ACO3BD_04925, partial [Chitinophagaceae bacterium]